MQIGTRFSLAIHILLCVEHFGKSCKVTGDFVAGSARTNPVIIRNIMAMLRKAGLIEIRPGTGGTKLLKSPAEITMRDVYAAVNPLKDGKLFKMHCPEPRCPVGGNIAELLSPVFTEAHEAMEESLAKTSLQDLSTGLNKKLPCP
jgi:DNA-binding IscR family transcriptional regulator